MYARVSRWEGSGADEVRRAAEQIQERSASGPPEGVPSNGLMMLTDPDNGRTLMIGLFETEDDLKKGDETLNSMNPPDDSMGSRTSVEFYEVSVDVRA